LKIFEQTLIENFSSRS